MARCWIETADARRFEDVVEVSRTLWSRVWTSWQPRGSIDGVVDP